MKNLLKIQKKNIKKDSSNCSDKADNCFEISHNNV